MQFKFGTQVKVNKKEPFYEGVFGRILDVTLDNGWDSETRTAVAMSFYRLELSLPNNRFHQPVRWFAADTLELT